MLEKSLQSFLAGTKNKQIVIGFNADDTGSRISNVLAAQSCRQKPQMLEILVLLTVVTCEKSEF